MKTDGQLTTAVVTLANRHKGQYRCRLDLTSFVALANTRKRSTEVPVRFHISCCTGERKMGNTGDLPVRFNINCCTGGKKKEGNTGDLPVRFNISCCTGEKKQEEIHVTCRFDLI